jgi:type I restriction enzyme S subunit
VILAIGDIFDFIRNGMSVKQSSDIDGLPITRIETIWNAEIDLSRVGYAGVQFANAKDYLLKDGDILFSHINSVAHIGKCALYSQSHGELVHGMNLLCFRPKQTKILPKYALYILRSNQFKDQLAKSIKKAVNQASVTISDIKKIQIEIPPLAEQQRIAAILDKAELVKRKRELAIEKLDELAQSVFVSEVGDLYTNSKNLEFKKLNEVCSFSQGIQVDVDKQSSHKNDEHNTRFLRIIDFTQGNQEPRYISNPGNRFFLKSDEIAMVRYGATTGFVCSGLDGVIANNLFKFTIKNDDFTAIYVYLYLKSNYFQSQLKTLISGAAMPALNFGMLDKFIIPLITKDKQHNIKNQMIHLEKSIQKSKKSLEDLLALSHSLKNQAFSGQL